MPFLMHIPLFFELTGRNWPVNPGLSREKRLKPRRRSLRPLNYVHPSIILSPSFSRSLQVASRFMAIKVADAASIFQPSLDRTAHTTTNWQCRARLSVDRPTEYRPDVEGKPTRLKENPSIRLDRMQVRYNLSCTIESTNMERRRIPSVGASRPSQSFLPRIN
jgi:hypothetical protein